MMKKLVWLGSVVAAGMISAGCGTGFPNGLIYTDLRVPLAVNSSDKGEIGDYHVGEVTGSKWFGLFVYGDVNYAKAVQNAGGFSRVQRVEYFSKDICGCGRFGIRVYGEPLKNNNDSKSGASK